MSTADIAISYNLDAIPPRTGDDRWAREAQLVLSSDSETGWTLWTRPVTRRYIARTWRVPLGVDYILANYDPADYDESES